MTDRQGTVFPAILSFSASHADGGVVSLDRGQGVLGVKSPSSLGKEGQFCFKALVLAPEVCRNIVDEKFGNDVVGAIAIPQSFDHFRHTAVNGITILVVHQES